MVRDMPEHGGATVTAVGSADEALAALNASAPYVLVCDRPHRPRRSQHRASILRAGFQHHVDKPAATRQLVKVVATRASRG
jgi:hypothetical protein